MSIPASDDWSPDLPWSPFASDENRFRKIFFGSITGAFVLCLVIPHIHVPQLSREERDLQATQSRIISVAMTAHFELPPEVLKPTVVPLKNKSTAPTATTPKKTVKEEQETHTTVHERDTKNTQEKAPPPETTENRATSDMAVQQARAKASALLKDQGLDQLAALRDLVGDHPSTGNTPLSAKGTESTEDGGSRAMITSSVRSGSGGLAEAGLSGKFSSGFGGGKEGSRRNGAIQEVAGSAHEQAVHSNIGEGKHTDTGVQKRSGGDIARGFDRFNGALQALYQRALRDNPALQGSVTVKLTITADGAVSACEVVSSQLNDPELEQKIAMRIKLFHFDPINGDTWTGTHTINFLPPT